MIYLFSYFPSLVQSVSGTDKIIARQKVSCYYLQDFVAKYYLAECGDFVTNLWLWSCINNNHDKYLCVIILTVCPERICY